MILLQILVILVNYDAFTLDWWGIMKKYYYQKSSNSQKVYVSGIIKLAKSITDNYSKGKFLKNDDLPDLIREKVEKGFLPEDSNGIYFVLISDDVKEQMQGDEARFCVEYCGYHNEEQFKSKGKMFYAMAGQLSSECLSGCSPNDHFSPNDDPSVDGIAGTIAHELAEAVSDPWVNTKRAWNAPDGQENGDLCSTVYGKTSKMSNGALYNYISPNSKTKFLIQENFDPVLQSCRQTA
jgi:hypothetical protein